MCLACEGARKFAASNTNPASDPAVTSIYMYILVVTSPDVGLLIFFE